MAQRPAAAGECVGPAGGGKPMAGCAGGGADRARLGGRSHGYCGGGLLLRVLRKAVAIRAAACFHQACSPCSARPSARRLVSRRAVMPVWKKYVLDHSR